MTTAHDLEILHDAPIPTWFGIGGRARRFAVVRTIEDLQRAIEIDPDLLVLGDGANLLVDDAGVDNLVISLEGPGFNGCGLDDETGLYAAGAGARLPRVINETTRIGLGGLEKLGGIPASIGGAIVMNAGGAFGQIAESIIRVHAIDRAGRLHAIDRSRIDFGYRQSHLGHLIITSAEFDLQRASCEGLRASLKLVLGHKKGTQPLRDRSAGCVFKNPNLEADIDGLGVRGQRVGAGLVLDRAGCKGMRVGGACVSDRHANFVVTTPDARASEVIELIDLCAQRAVDRFGIALEREVVIWGGHQ